MLRSIGNRLRRNDDATVVQDSPSFAAKPSVTSSAAAATAVIPPTPIMADETPDLYAEDLQLGFSIRELEDVRGRLRELTNRAGALKDSLIATAGTERSLGENLGDMLAPPMQGENDGMENPSDSVPHFTRFLRSEDITAQRELGQGLSLHADSTVKLANAFANPLGDLQRSFEERITRKITPLRKRYVDQKGQYLKYKRQAHVADNDERRSYYEALAEAAKPVWLRTSTELRTEANVMTELTARNMAKWARSLALQHERALAIAAANFSEAFQQAKANNIR